MISKESEEVGFGYVQNQNMLRTSFGIFLSYLYATERYKSQVKSLNESRPFLIFRSTIDPSATQLEIALHNKAFHYKDEFWNTFRPPNSPFDRSGVDSMSKSSLESRGYALINSSGKIEFKTVDYLNKKYKTSVFIEAGNLYFAYPGWDVNFFTE